MEREHFSPRLYARLCGALYLYIIVAGIFAEIFVRGRLVVAGDAAATAANITANELLFRVGFSGEMLHLAFDVIVAVLLYALLQPVGRTLALLAALGRVACDIVLATSSLSHFAALRLLKLADGAFDAAQREALALFALRLHGDAYAISLVFFAFCCLALGVLIYRSGFLPRPLGILMTIAGICYFVDSFAHFLAPGVAGKLFPVLFIPMFVAELSLTLWLLIKGVDTDRWQQAVDHTNGALARSGDP